MTSYRFSHLSLVCAALIGGVFLGNSAQGGHFSAVERNNPNGFPCDVSRVDVNTQWTPEKFLDRVVRSEKLSFVHWRAPGVGNNELGDRFLCDMIKYYGDSIDQFVVVDLAAVEDESPAFCRKLRKLVAELRPRDGKGAGEVVRVPSYSLVFPDGSEDRVLGPPTIGGYDRDFYQNYKPGLDQLLLGREQLTQVTW